MKTNAAQAQAQEKENFLSLRLCLCLRRGRFHGEVRILILALVLTPVLASLMKTRLQCPFCVLRNTKFKTRIFLVTPEKQPEPHGTMRILRGTLFSFTVSNVRIQHNKQHYRNALVAALFN